MSVKLVFMDGSKLIEIFQAVKVINDEVDLRLDENGLRIRQMDVQRVAMVDVFMPKEMFGEYDLAGSPTQAFAVDLSHFTKLKLKKSTPVTLTFNLETSKCQVQQPNRTFSIPFKQSEGAEAPHVAKTFETTAKMTLDTLQQIIDDAALCSDHMTIEANPDKLAFSAGGDVAELLRWSADLPVGNEALLEYSSNNPSKAVFSLSYLDRITMKTSTLAETVQLKFKTEFPILISLDSKDLKDLQLSYVLAPRIEAE